MLQSMTAFADKEIQLSLGTLRWELRSINHRYLEMSLRLPDAFHEIEVLIREHVRHYIKRGKIECFMRYQPSETTNADMILNVDLVQKLCRATEAIAKQLNNPAPVSTLDVLHWPGVLQVAEVDVDIIQNEVLQLLEQTLQNLVEARCREGEQLKKLFLQRLEGMTAELVKVRKRIPEILNGQRERLMSRFSEASLQLDSGRLEQELVLLAQKIDVTEEIERLETHIAEVLRVLKHGGSMGRRLDFLMQELNREANTLGSKSVDTDTTRASVELKVLIEQMREQVQNVE